MCYVCGKSRKKIIHTENCGYAKRISEENRKYYCSLADAAMEGYVLCERCSHIGKYLKREKQKINRICEENGIRYESNAVDGSLDIYSSSGVWKIIVNGQRHYIWLYHKNNGGYHPGELVPGYHSQKVRKGTLEGYLWYIVEHDRYREKNPDYRRQDNVMRMGSKAKKKLLRKEKISRRKWEIRNVLNLIESLSAEKCMVSV